MANALMSDTRGTIATTMGDVGDLVRLAAALCGDGVTSSERALIDAHPGTVSPEVVQAVVEQVKAGLDPLGDAYTQLFSPQERRPLGQTYTPSTIIEAMVSWAQDQGVPARIVDPGAGSGRYLLAAGRAFPTATLVGADIDPLSALMLRANVAAAGLTDRATVVLGDYRSLRVPKIADKTLYIGNPPYVRHHQISPEWKSWLIETAKRRGLKASGLAGLHVHFFLATAEHGHPGDYGAFITSAEWLVTIQGRDPQALAIV